MKMFDEKEEKVLKLLAAKLLAKAKLDKVNLEMGTAIRAEFSKFDLAKREEYAPQYEPLQLEIKGYDDDLNKEAE